MAVIAEMVGMGQSGCCGDYRGRMSKVTVLCWLQGYV